MNFKPLFLVLSLLFSLPSMAAKQAVEAITEIDTLNLHFATLDEAHRLLSADDSYTRSLSEFDIASRLGRVGGTKEQLRAFSLSQAREWTETEKGEWRKIMWAINRTIRREGYSLPLPSVVVLIKSGMADEGGAAGYTRSTEIVIADSLVGRRSEKFCTDLLLHEMFHVMTRHSAEFKRRMYAAIGFEVVDKGLTYPEDLRSRHISNPDINAFDCLATFSIDGRRERCAMLLYADRPYEGGSFFEYLRIGFVPYDAALQPIQKAGRTVIYTMQQVSDFYDKVGRNTNYTLHPEEIMAENFVLAFTRAADVETPELLNRVRSILTGQAR